MAQGSSPEGVTIVEHPLVQIGLGRLRSKETSTGEFRRIVNDLGALLAYEAARDLPTETVAIETPLAKTTGIRPAGRPPCLVSIMRAGNGLLDGALRSLPDADVGYVGLKRDETTLQPREYYFNVPPDLAGRWVLMVDPMVATGHSAAWAAERLRTAGATHLSFACLLASPEGLARFRGAHPGVPVVTASIDDGLSAEGFILPGLGDAGDRMFGTE